MKGPGGGLPSGETDKGRRRLSDNGIRRGSLGNQSRGADEWSGSYRDLLAENSKLSSKIEELQRRNEDLEARFKKELQAEREKSTQLDMHIDEFRVLYGKAKEDASAYLQQLSSTRAECQRNWSLFDEARQMLEAEKCEAASLRDQVRHLRDALDAERRQRGVQSMQRDSLTRRQSLGVALSLDLAASDTQADETDTPDASQLRGSLTKAELLAGMTTVNEEDDPSLDEKHLGGGLNASDRAAASTEGEQRNESRMGAEHVHDPAADEELRSELECAVVLIEDRGRQNEALEFECAQLQQQVIKASEAEQETRKTPEGVSELLRQNAELRHRCMKLRSQVARAMDAEREVRTSDDILIEGERMRDVIEAELVTRRSAEADFVRTLEDLQQKCEQLRLQAGKTVERENKTCKTLEKGLRREGCLQQEAGQPEARRMSGVRRSVQEDTITRQSSGRWQHEREELHDQVAAIVEAETEKRRSAVNISNHLEQQCKLLRERAATSESAEADGVHIQKKLRQEYDEMSTNLEGRLARSEAIESEREIQIVQEETELCKCQQQECELEQKVSHLDVAEREAQRRAADGLHLAQRLFDEWRETSTLSESQQISFRALAAELSACELETTITAESGELAQKRLEEAKAEIHDHLEMRLTYLERQREADLAEISEESEELELRRQEAKNSLKIRDRLESEMRLVENQSKKKEVEVHEQCGHELRLAKVSEEEMHRRLMDKLKSEQGLLADEFKFKQENMADELKAEQWKMSDELKTEHGKMAEELKAVQSQCMMHVHESASEGLEARLVLEQGCADLNKEIKELMNENEELRRELELQVAYAAKSEAILCLQEECDQLKHEATGAASALRDANRAVEQELRRSHDKLEKKTETQRRPSQTQTQRRPSQTQTQRRPSQTHSAELRANEELRSEYDSLKLEVIEACLNERKGRMVLEEELHIEEEELHIECHRNEELETQWMEAALEIEQEGDACRSAEEQAGQSAEFENECRNLYDKLENSEQQFNLMQIQSEGDLGSARDLLWGIEQDAENEKKNAMQLNRQLECECSQLRDLAAGALDAERKARACAEHTMAESDTRLQREVIECEEVIDKVRDEATHANESESKVQQLAEQRLQKLQRLQRENEQLRTASSAASSDSKRLSVFDARKLERECEELREQSEMSESRFRKMRRSSGLQVNKDLQREVQQCRDEAARAAEARSEAETVLHEQRRDQDQKWSVLEEDLLAKLACSEQGERTTRKEFNDVQQHVHELAAGRLQEFLEHEELIQRLENQAELSQNMWGKRVAMLEDECETLEEQSHAINCDAEASRNNLEEVITRLEEECGVVAGSAQAGLHLHQHLRNELEEAVGSAQVDLHEHQQHRRELERRHERAAGAAQAEYEAAGELQERLAEVEQQQRSIQELADMSAEAHQEEVALKSAACEQYWQHECEVLMEQLASALNAECEIKKLMQGEVLQQEQSELEQEALHERLAEIRERESSIEELADMAVRAEQEGAAQTAAFKQHWQQEYDGLLEEVASALRTELESKTSFEHMLMQNEVLQEEQKLDQDGLYEKLAEMQQHERLAHLTMEAYRDEATTHTAESEQHWQGQYEFLMEEAASALRAELEANAEMEFTLMQSEELQSEQSTLEHELLELRVHERERADNTSKDAHTQLVDELQSACRLLREENHEMAISSAKDEMQIRQLEESECQAFEELALHSAIVDVSSKENILREEVSNAKNAEKDMQRLLHDQAEQHSALQQQCVELRSHILGAVAEEREVRNSSEVEMLQAIHVYRSELEDEAKQLNMAARNAEMVFLERNENLGAEDAHDLTECRLHLARSQDEIHMLQEEAAFAECSARENKADASKAADLEAMLEKQMQEWQVHATRETDLKANFDEQKKTMEGRLEEQTKILQIQATREADLQAEFDKLSKIMEAQTANRVELEAKLLDRDEVIRSMRATSNYQSSTTNAEEAELDAKREAMKAGELEQCRQQCRDRLLAVCSEASRQRRAYGAKQLLIASMGTAQLAFAAAGQASTSASAPWLSEVAERQQTLLEECSRLRGHTERTTALEERLQEMLLTRCRRRLP